MDLLDIRECLRYWQTNPPADDLAAMKYQATVEPRSKGMPDKPYQPTPTDPNRVVVTPTSIQEMSRFPNVSLGLNPVKKLISFPIRVPGDNYKDPTPDWLRTKVTAGV
jgi:hypothetical protein